MTLHDHIRPLHWENDALEILDQRALPESKSYLRADDYATVIRGIKEMWVRGAPAIGIAAAYGMVLAARQGVSLEQAAEELRSARPTAVNLAWAVGRMLAEAKKYSEKDLVEHLLDVAKKIHHDDIEHNKRMGEYGAELLPNCGGILTHCNTGSLATGGYGTALGVIRAAWSVGKELDVYVDETRPWLQGARLTAWELMQDNISATLIADSAAGMLMQRGKIQAVIVGADRIAANGDVANKIGTYGLAVQARHHGIPFFVAAPVSTIDLSCPSGVNIPIEERAAEEVTGFRGVKVAPDGVKVYNPVFDITPVSLISAIITERGALAWPNVQTLAQYMESDE